MLAAIRSAAALAPYLLAALAPYLLAAFCLACARHGCDLSGALMSALMGPLDRYRGHLVEQGYRPATVDVRVRVVRLALAHSDVADPADLTRADVVDWLMAKPRADWTRIKYAQHLSAFLVWAGLPDVTADVRRPRTPVGVPKPIREGDLARVLDVASARVRPWLLLGAYCGLRSFETAKVRADDLERAGDGSWLLRVEGKGGQIAVVPAPPVVVDALLPLVEDAGGRGRLWPGVTPAAVQSAVRRACARAGVRASSHQLRHRYGTALYSLEADLLTTQQLMRHRSPTTTAGYAAVAGDRLGQVAQQLPGATGAARRHLRAVT
jgi:integrase